MTKCFIVKRTKRKLVLSIGQVVTTLEEGSAEAFCRVMEQRGWSAQELFDYLMDTKHKRPWSMIARMGNSLNRRAILTDESLGALFLFRRKVDGVLMTFRQKKGAASTSFTKAPREWDAKFPQVTSGAYFDAEGNFAMARR